MLVLASLTDPIVEFAVDVVDALGLPGIFLLMVAESACIPIPSETTFLFAGFNVARGEYSAVRGRRDGHVRQRRRLLDRLRGRLLRARRHAREARAQAAHQAVAPALGRRLVRALRRRRPCSSRACCRSCARSSRCRPGVARMPFWRFTVLTTLGCVPWILMLTLIGREVGDNWEQWKDSLHYVDYAVAACIVLGALWLFCAAPRSRRRGRGDRRAGRRCAALTPRRSRSGCCTARSELVPVSSSGHVAALPWLLGWEVAGWDGARRKELEVALHAGAAAALLIVLRPGARCGRGCWPRRCCRRRRSGSRSSGGSRSGSARRRRWPRGCSPARAGAGARRPRRGRRATTATPACATALALGCAQAAALIPGVSRNGATLAAGRARGFGRAGASRLSWEVALPVLAGASALKGGARRAQGAAQRAAARDRRRRRVRLHARGRARRSGSSGARRCGRGRVVARRRSRPPSWPCGTIGRDDRRATPVAGVDTGAADRAIGALVGVLRTIDTGRAVAHRAAARATTPPCSRWRRTSASPSARTASARS